MSSSPSSSYMSTTTLKPYLELPHLLSLTWLAYPILSLLFVAFRLQISAGSAQDAVDGAKADLLTSCKAAERAATGAASMPRFMAIATNQQFAEAVNGSLNAARAALVLSLTVMEGIINFIIDLYRSTFLCFLELVIRGGLAILIGAVEELNKAVRVVSDGLRNAIQNEIGTANSAMKSAVDAINKINPFSDIQAPQINVPDLSGLENVSLPPGFQEALTKLNSTLPGFDDLKQKIEDVINTPFELLKKEINETFDGLSFNADALPVPQSNVLSFCNDLDTSVVDDLGKDLIRITKIGIIVLILLALILIALNCLLEWYKWRCLRRHLEYTRQAWSTDPTIHEVQKGVPQVTLTDHNLLMLQANSAHPLLTRIANTVSSRFHLSPSQHTHLFWFFSYIFHPPALACLLIGFFGLMSIQIQLAVMGPLSAKYSAQAASTVSDFSNTIATSINASMYNQSSAYANDVNARVDLMQTTVNEGVFGWVNGTTTTLNTTLNAFYDDVQNAVSLVFDGTILEQPAKEFIRCIIGTKVEAFENALNFMHDNLKIDVPRVNQSVLVLSQSSVDEATRPVALAAIGDGGSDDGGVIGKLINSYANALRQERVMFAIFMGLWGFVIVMGLCVILWHSYGLPLVEAGRRKKWEREQRGHLVGSTFPLDAHSEKNISTGSAHDIRSFTPLPSPKTSSGFHPFTAFPGANDEKTQDSLFDRRHEQRKRTISQPRKLLALKSVGRERLFGPYASSETIVAPDSQDGKTSWFGRIGGLMGRKHNPPPYPQGPDTSVLDLSADDRPSTNSRWSTSPKDPSTRPWGTRIGLPSRPHVKLRPINTLVPADVPAHFEGSTQPLQAPHQFAPPIHHGFDNPTSESHKQRISPAAVYYSTPNSSGHRRSSSVPITPTTNARKSSALYPSENPFVTPFDDEHRVTDRSMNPYAGVIG